MDMHNTIVNDIDIWCWFHSGFLVCLLATGPSVDTSWLEERGARLYLDAKGRT